MECDKLKQQVESLSSKHDTVNRLLQERIAELNSNHKDTEVLSKKLDEKNVACATLQVCAHYTKVSRIGIPTLGV